MAILALAIEKLSENSDAVPSVQLEAYPQFRRAKSGEYRIIFRIENQQLTLYVVRLGKRNDGEVYKNLDSLQTE